MAWGFKSKRSHGVAVTAEVHRFISKANNARDAGRWSIAAEFFDGAVARDPTLFHIWLQLGHARKEAGEYQEAETAYLKAIALRPDMAEAFLQLGHLYKVDGRPSEAARRYLDAAKIAPDNADAIAEFTRILAQFRDNRQEEIAKLIVLAGFNQSTSIAGAVPLNGKDSTIIFDASDLIGYYMYSRLPSGIQRVQIEAINNAILAGDRPVRICCFINGRDDWLEVPIEQFQYVTDLSIKNGIRNDSEWVSALNRLHLTLALADPFEFPESAALVNLGTSWWLQNYFLFVRHAKTKSNIKYIPFVHDLIPIMTPQHCVRELTQDFISWAIGVFEHADHFLVNSEATKRDLLTVANTLGHSTDAVDVSVVRLDADFRKPNVAILPDEVLSRWQLADEPFALFVSTIESRKGHIVALEAWARLIERHGASAVPRLICVGKNGWLNDDVFKRLQEDKLLADRVNILSNLADEELSLLYRSCQFTIYPSTYEGWGLPITEALCYGKVVIAADGSSLKEAGGSFAVYFKPGSITDLANVVEKVSFDPAYRLALEKHILESFSPRSWRDVARQIETEVIDVQERQAKAKGLRPPVAKINAYHPIGRNNAMRIWPGIGSGEIFRSGLNWLWPDDWGCWAKPAGGQLRIGLPDGCGDLRVYLWLRNIPELENSFHVTVGGKHAAAGALSADEERWVYFECHPMAGETVLNISLSCENSTLIKMITAGIEQEYWVSVGLKGFFLCEACDREAQFRLIEAVSLSSIESLDAFRESCDARDRPVR